MAYKLELIALALVIFKFHHVLYNIINRPLDTEDEDYDEDLDPDMRHIYVREYPEDTEEFKRGDIIQVDICKEYARRGSHWRKFSRYEERV